MRNSINTSINTSIRNELKLNSQTKLWLNIISIPAIELKEKIEKAIEENPFLEYDIKSNHNNLDINSIIEIPLQIVKKVYLSILKVKYQ